ncbi:MAG TPA: hypothetical protein PKM88_00685, partial [bacterium]|nr:hypothetical protein [bacterium]
ATADATRFAGTSGNARISGRPMPPGELHRGYTLTLTTVSGSIPPAVPVLLNFLLELVRQKYFATANKDYCLLV